VIYDGVRIELGYKPDLIVDHDLIIELKTVGKLLPLHEAQLLTYLRLSGIVRGFLMNFNSQPLAKGIR
jgi:GxxExxY protein